MNGAAPAFSPDVQQVCIIRMKDDTDGLRYRMTNTEDVLEERACRHNG
jgi:hypothetical protein